WSVDNTAVATLSTDPATPSELTAVSSGTVTLIASVGSVSAQTQVTILNGTSLPVGTILWSVPTVLGFTTQQIIQAVPTTLGTPSLYTLEAPNGPSSTYLIRGFSGSGQDVWQASLENILDAKPDGFGGILARQATDDCSPGCLERLIDLDGQTGA